MQRAEAKTATFDARSSDLHLVSRAIARDPDAFRTIMQRNNQRLYRIARGVVRDDVEAEDVVQEAYVRAFSDAAAPYPHDPVNFRRGMLMILITSVRRSGRGRPR